MAKTDKNYYWILCKSDMDHVGFSYPHWIHRLTTTKNGRYVRAVVRRMFRYANMENSVADKDAVNYGVGGYVDCEQNISIQNGFASDKNFTVEGYVSEYWVEVTKEEANAICISVLTGTDDWKNYVPS